jgi:hypothetical protein
MINDVIETISGKYGISLEIFFDEDPLNPREEFDNLGTMVCFHRRYSLGDKHPYSSPKEFFRGLATDVNPVLSETIEYLENGRGGVVLSEQQNGAEKCEEMVDKLIKKTLSEKVIMLPLYLYDHSGISMSTNPFSCSWDSGQVGYIYVTKEEAKREFDMKRTSKKFEDLIKKRLIAEVEEYNKFLTGEVYGYCVVDEGENFLDSCWGYYDLEDCKKEGHSMMEHHEKVFEKRKAEELELERVRKENEPIEEPASTRVVVVVRGGVVVDIYTNSKVSFDILDYDNMSDVEENSDEYKHYQDLEREIKEIQRRIY